MNNPERSHNPQELSVERQLLRDFYLGFQFSQGSNQVQHCLYAYLGGYYTDNWTPDQAQEMRGLLPTLADRVMAMQPPRDHIELFSLRRTSEIENEWNIFAKRLRLVKPRVEKDGFRAVGQAILSQTILGMVEGDLAFVTQGRLYHSHDAHFSYIREYVVLGNDTGSPAFNELCTRGRALLEDSHPGDGIRSNYDSLVRHWEDAHSGKAFLE